MAPPRPSAAERRTPALLFDLDGTLMDSNYEHIACWQRAFRRADVTIPNAFLHRCIGMRDDLLIAAVARETGKRISEKTAATAELTEAGAFRIYAHPADLLGHLAEIGVDC
jgi:beta-phosphoglucomutase-like phosphatase (HAD superfamily)